MPPVWLMRQAGRYLPEYLDVRARHDFLEVCRTPELACEVTVQPIRRFGFDAAILFSDILVPLVPMGVDLSFGKGHGPIIANPMRTRADVLKLKRIEPRESLKDVLESIRMIRAELPPEVALIGFAGAPFTLATYMIEGGKPDPFAHVKGMLYSDPEAFRSLLETLGDMVADYLAAMVEAGADAVQLFDTWAGILPAREFRAVNLPVLQSIFSKPGGAERAAHVFRAGGDAPAGRNPRHGRDGGGPRLADGDCGREARAGAADRACRATSIRRCCLGSEAAIRRETRRVVDEARGGGHIFNLGHGILPITPLSAVEVMLDEIRGGRK